MKITHLSVVRELSLGQLLQLRAEVASAGKLQGVRWKTVAYQDSPSDEAFVKRTPRVFRILLLRNLWGWLVALKEARASDVLLMRHMTFDPFAIIFSWMFSNRATVHHAKEVEELILIKAGWKGRAASMLERVTGRVAVRNSLMIFGVTKEIATYQTKLHSVDKEPGVYPNGIEPELVPLLADHRSAHVVNVVFLCGKFSEWHGLDKLIAAVDGYVPLPDDPSLSIHLIGKLSDSQLRAIVHGERNSKLFRAHGSLSAKDYRPILEQCDVGIASLAMERQNLREGSTLKVREMLALGLPIYSGHHDVALNPSKDFVTICTKVSIRDLIDLGLRNKTTPRHLIRSESLHSIDKARAMAGVAQVLSYKLRRFE